MDTSAVVGIICFVMAFIANISALAYGYGMLRKSVETNKSNISRNDTAIIELFARLGVIEVLAGRIEDAAGRWEKIMSNGINTKIAGIDSRLDRLEQHCKDMHERREVNKG